MQKCGGGGQGPELVKELRRDLTLDRLVSVHRFLSRARIFVINILRSREPANFQSAKLANRNGCTKKDNYELNGYCDSLLFFDIARLGADVTARPKTVGANVITLHQLQKIDDI